MYNVDSCCHERRVQSLRTLTMRKYLPFSGLNFASGSLEIVSLKPAVCRLKLPSSSACFDSLPDQVPGVALDDCEAAASVAMFVA